MRKIIIAGNWKMNKTFSETDDFLFEITDYLRGKDLGNVEVVICPPFLYIEMGSDFANESNIYIGAQNVSNHESGAFTGEVSAPMLRSMDIDYCIIGHSERRKYYQESDELVNQKLKILLDYDIIPIVCVGETLEQREKGITEEIVINQLNRAFKDIEINDNVVIAYEPVWAIGTGKTATPQQAQEIQYMIRKWIVENYSQKVADQTPILYGGSMKPENIKELLLQPDIDGGLVGGASLDIEKFTKMIEIATELG